MWSNFQMLLGVLGGLFAGLVVASYFYDTSTSTKSKLSSEEERDRRDPANWWKYGGKPHDD